MDVFTTVACVIALVILPLVGLAFYSIRQSSTFEDALPGYALSAAISKAHRTGSKASRKKKTGKQKSSEQKPKDDGAIKGQESKGDDGQETETDSDDEDSDRADRIPTATKQRKKSEQRQVLADEDVDLLSYSKNFKLDSKKKTAANLLVPSAAKKPSPRATITTATPTQNSVLQTTVATTGKQSTTTSPSTAGGTTLRRAGVQPVVDTVVSTTSPQSQTSRTTTGANNGLPTQVHDVIKATSSWNNDAIRKLVNTLGARLGGSTGTDDWELKTAKGDPVSVLKRQLEDKDLALKDALNKVQALTARYNESRAELNSARDRNTVLEQQSQQIQKSLSTEIDALRKRMQHSHDEHVTTLRSVQTTTTSPGELNRHNTENKTEENVQQKLKIMDDALKQNVLLLNESKNARQTLELKLKQNDENTKNLEQKLKAAEEAHAKKIEELSDDLLKLEARNRGLLHDLEEAKKTKTVELQQLQDKENLAADFESKLQLAESRLNDLQQSVETNASKLQERDNLVGELESKLRTVELQRDSLQKAVEETEAKLKEEAASSKSKDTKHGEMLGQLNELRQTRDNLQSEVDQYKRVLADTERLLKELQDKTESVELDWKQKLEAATSSLETAENEVKRLREEIDHGHNNKEPLINGGASTHELDQNVSQGENGL